MFAAQHGKEAIVTLLLHAGGDPNLVGTHGLSAIGFARQNGHAETLRLLTRGKV
ncbi:MAG TPA: ankyrin repeat domain-containing protein [Planctomycetota bacterium]